MRGRNHSIFFILTKIFVFKQICINSIKGNKDGNVMFKNTSNVSFIDTKSIFENTIRDIKIIININMFKICLKCKVIIFKNIT